MFEHLRLFTVFFAIREKHVNRRVADEERLVPRRVFGHHPIIAPPCVAPKGFLASSRETDLRISEIAARCGYRDANYLKNLFKKRTGMSMREWRAQSAPHFAGNSQ